MARTAVSAHDTRHRPKAPVRFEETTDTSLYFSYLQLYTGIETKQKDNVRYTTIVYHALHALIASTNVPSDRSRALSRQFYSVSQKNPPLKFSDIFPKRLGIFSARFTRLLYVPIYTRLQIFIQLSATLTKLCHIKCDHPGHIIICSMSTIG